jgi:hypothetical protein
MASAMANPVMPSNGSGEKRQETGAVQDATRWLGVMGFAPASWSAVALHRFPQCNGTVALPSIVPSARKINERTEPATPWLATFRLSLAG